MSEKELPNNGIPTNTKETLASNYALHVALQTMKERCQNLQQRLTVVEDENINLRMNYGIDKSGKEADVEFIRKGQSEMDVLREKVAELTRQKMQLTEHIAMVATENRQLWSRLSKITKDNHSLGNSLNKMKDTLTSNQCLIRSKTFTQNSPNPALRHKLNPNLENDISPENLSLEEISLKLLNNFIESKTEVEKQCEEMICPKNTSIGFGYLQHDPSNSSTTITKDDDNKLDVKKCINGFEEMKKELLKQQSDLKVALSGLRQIRDICPSCKQKQEEMDSKDQKTFTKVLSIDSSSTSFSAQNLLESRNHLLDRQKDEIILDNNDKKQTGILIPFDISVDFIEQKRMADALDKMCPLCGKIFSMIVTFDEFQEHVESHFVDDGTSNDNDLNVEQNFEIISNSVSNF